MSKSVRKTPIFKVCQARNGQQKKWKNSCSRALRRSDEDVGDGAYYRRISGNIWDSPSDGKMYSLKRSMKK